MTSLSTAFCLRAAFMLLDGLLAASTFTTSKLLAIEQIHSLTSTSNLRVS